MLVPYYQPTTRRMMRGQLGALFLASTQSGANVSRYTDASPERVADDVDLVSVIPGLFETRVSVSLSANAAGILDFLYASLPGTVGNPGADYKIRHRQSRDFAANFGGINEVATGYSRVIHAYDPKGKRLVAMLFRLDEPLNPGGEAVHAWDVTVGTLSASGTACDWSTPVEVEANAATVNGDLRIRTDGTLTFSFSRRDGTQQLGVCRKLKDDGSGDWTFSEITASGYLPITHCLDGSRVVAMIYADTPSIAVKWHLVIGAAGLDGVTYSWTAPVEVPETEMQAPRQGASCLARRGDGALEFLWLGLLGGPAPSQLRRIICRGGLADDGTGTWVETG